MEDNLVRLIRAYYDGKMAEEDFLSLRRQLDAKDSQQLRSIMESLWEETETAGSIDWEKKEKILQAINSRIAFTDGHTNDDAYPHQNAGTDVVPVSRGITRWLKLAAVIIAVLAAGATVWYHQYIKVTPPAITAEVKQAMEQSKATGTDEAEVTAVPGKANPTIRQILRRYCNDEDVVEQLAEANQISTHLNKEGWITLDDGTLVHLNSGSRLVYPEKFGRGDRDVILDGEAYFMVAKDRSRTFVVHTKNGDIREYGTEFNVNARSDRPNTEVVLVSGSIGVTPVDGSEKMMTPGTMALMENGNCETTTVDTEPYKAWNTGHIDFDNWTLGRIMNVMARWYNKDVEFANESLKQERLSGTFDRYTDAEATLKALSAATEHSIVIKDGVILVAE